MEDARTVRVTEAILVGVAVVMLEIESDSDVYHSDHGGTVRDLWEGWTWAHAEPSASVWWRPAP